NRSGQTVLEPAAPAAAAATAAAAGPPFAAGRLTGANRAGLFVRFVLVGFAFLGDDAGNRDRFERHAAALGFLTRRTAFARFAGTAAPPAPPLALVAVSRGFTVSRLAYRRILGEPFGLVGLHLRFGFDVERLVVVEGFLSLRRESCSLRRQQRLGGLQRVHLFAAIDDERLLRAHGRVGDDGKRHLEAVFEIAQMAALVIEDVKRNVSPGAHHEIVGRALHQDFLETAQQLQRHRRYRTDVAASAALRAGFRRTLQHAGANALARHFEQAEMRDASARVPGGAWR